MDHEPDQNLPSIAAIFAISFAVGLFVLHFFKFPVDETILDTQVRLVGLESTRPQSLFYMAILGMVALLCAAMLIWPKRRVIPNLGGANQLFMPGVMLASIFLGAWSKQFLLGFLLAAAFLIVSRTALLTFISIPSMKTNSSRFLYFFGVGFFWFSVGLVVVYFVIFLIAPFTTPLVIAAWEFLWLDWHYSVTILQGFELVKGSHPGTTYGLAMPLLSEISLKVLSFFGIPETNIVEVVKFNQIIASAMICLLGFLLNKKNFVYIILIALGMTAFTLSNVGTALTAPNQAGIRYIPFLASLLILVLELRRARFRIWILAAASGIFVIMSPETGLAAMGGYIVASVLKKYSPDAPLSSIMKSLVLFFIFFIISFIGGLVFIVKPIMHLSITELFNFLTLFTAGGYGGLADKPSMSATLIFFLAATAVMRGVYSARNGVATSTDVYQASIGTIMMLWLIYYVNRMHEWNLWFQFVLLAMLIAPLIKIENLRSLFRRPIRHGITLSMIIACLIGAQIASSTAQVLPRLLAWQNHLGCDDGLVVYDDGVCLPGVRGTRLALQMQALVKRYSPSDTLVLTALPTYSKLQGFNEGFSPIVVCKKDVDALVNWIETNGPRYIVADDPMYDVAQLAPEYNRQILNYLKQLVSYRYIGRDAGWIILEKNEYN